MVAAKPGKSNRNDQLRVKDLVSDGDDCDDGLDVDEDDEAGKNSDFDEDHNNSASPIHQMDDSNEGINENFMNDQVMWPNNAKRQEASDEDDAAIAWPTKSTANSKVTFNSKNKKRNLKTDEAELPSKRGKTGNQKSSRYGKAEELAAVMNFMSDPDQDPLPQSK